jgi:hypothetical protein
MQWFEPLVDFDSPMSEDFAGTSKFSEKIQISAMRLAGGVVQPTPGEIARYVVSILKEKAAECSSIVTYAGIQKPVSDVLREMLGPLLTKAPAPVVENTPEAVLVANADEENLDWGDVKPAEKSIRGTPAGKPINFRQMIYSPLNEAGVVLLFSKIMGDLGIVYESSPLKGFDMVGRIQTAKGLEQKHFEFEYKSSNFKAHGHDESLIDYIVCWEHDWRDCPKHIEIIELRDCIKTLQA